MSRFVIDLGALPAETVAVLAQDPAPPPGQGPEFGKASPVGLIVILLLAVATALLIRSMSKRIRRLPTTFESADPADGSGERPADRDAEDARDKRP